MPYSAEHKESTRQRIVTSAARLFNRKGISEVTIGDIMTAAWLVSRRVRSSTTSRARTRSIQKSSLSSCTGRQSLGSRSLPRDARQASPLRATSSMPIYHASTWKISTGVVP